MKSRGSGLRALPHGIPRCVRVRTVLVHGRPVFRLSTMLGGTVRRRPRIGSEEPQLPRNLRPRLPRHGHGGHRTMGGHGGLRLFHAEGMERRADRARRRAATRADREGGWRHRVEFIDCLRRSRSRHGRRMGLELGRDGKLRRDRWGGNGLRDDGAVVGGRSRAPSGAKRGADFGDRLHVWGSRVHDWQRRLARRWDARLLRSHLESFSCGSSAAPDSARVHRPAGRTAHPALVVGRRLVARTGSAPSARGERPPVRILEGAYRDPSLSWRPNRKSISVRQRRYVTIVLVAIFAALVYLTTFLLNLHDRSDEVAPILVISFGGLMLVVLPALWVLYGGGLPAAVAFSERGFHLWYDNPYERQLNDDFIPWAQIAKIEFRDAGRYEKYWYLERTTGEGEDLDKLSAENLRALTAEWKRRTEHDLQGGQAAVDA